MKNLLSRNKRKSVSDKSSSITGANLASTSTAPALTGTSGSLLYNKAFSRSVDSEIHKTAAISGSTNAVSVSPAATAGSSANTATATANTKNLTSSANNNNDVANPAANVVYLSQNVGSPVSANNVADSHSLLSVSKNNHSHILLISDTVDPMTTNRSLSRMTTSNNSQHNQEDSSSKIVSNDILPIDLFFSPSLNNIEKTFVSHDHETILDPSSANNNNNNNKNPGSLVPSHNFDHVIFKSGWLNKSIDGTTRITLSTSNSLPSNSTISPDGSNVQSSSSNTNVNINNSMHTISGILGSNNSNNNNNIGNNNNNNSNEEFTTDGIIRDGNNGNDNWRLVRAELKGTKLILHKPPSDLAIKSFDSVDPSAQAAQELKDYHLVPPPFILKNERTGSIPSVSDSIHSRKASIINTSTGLQPSSNGIRSSNLPAKREIQYLSESYPHPDLQFDSASTTSNAIINGSLESVCHTILFKPSSHSPDSPENNKLLQQLMTVIPLFGDVKIAIDYFMQYGTTFISQSSLAIFRQKCGHGSNSFKIPIEPWILGAGNKKIIISSQLESVIIQRLCDIVIATITEQFPGMLLDHTIFEKLLKLVEIIALHDTQSSLESRITSRIIDTQRAMTELLSFPTDPNSPPQRTINKEETSLSADLFLKMDMEELSGQINLIDLRFNEKWNPKTDASLLYLFHDNNPTYSRYNPLVFDPISNIHYLGRLLVLHIFEDPEAKRNIHMRAKLIQKWVQLGTIFDKKGDMVSWLTIATVICSVPILRLKKTWSVVDSDTVKVVTSEWGQVVFELEKRNMSSEVGQRASYHVIAPQGIGETYSKNRVVPYFGDLVVKKSNDNAISTLRQCEKRVQRIKISFSRWEEYLSVVKESKEFSAVPAPIPKIQRLLYNLMGMHVALPCLTQDDIMDLSLKVELANSTSMYHYYNTTLSLSSSQAGGQIDVTNIPMKYGCFYPVLFTDILPNFKLFEKKVLVDAGNPALGMPSNKSEQCKSVTGVAVIDNSIMKLQQANNSAIINGSSPFASIVKDVLNIGTNVFHVLDDLIFKALSYKVPADDSKPILVNVVAKASSFDKLVDILVLTPNIFAPLIAEQDIKRYLLSIGLQDTKRGIKLDMDIGIYTETFFATYKSFCSLSELIAALKHRFVNARSAAISIKKMKEFKDSAQEVFRKKIFPDWNCSFDKFDSAENASIDDVNWKYVAQIEAGILEALHALFADFYSDFTDDISSKRIFVDFLKTVDQEITHNWKHILAEQQKRKEKIMESKDELAELSKNLGILYKKIRKFYIKRSYRPLDQYSAPHTFSSVIDFPPEFALIPTKFSDIEQLIDRLDVSISDLFSQINIAEWMNVADLFEMQYHSKNKLTGMFNYKIPSSAISEEDLKIFNVFTWLESLFIEPPEIKVLLKFPSNIRALYGLHGKITSYFLNQIIEPRISINKRRSRMTSILQMLAICKARMKAFSVANNSSNSYWKSNGSSIPAFLETCIAIAVSSPESRWFANDWIYASFKLHNKEQVSGQKWDTLDELIPVISKDQLNRQYSGIMTPCFGWISERFIEIGCFLPNVSVENPVLLNFDKRRYLYSLLTILKTAVSKSKEHYSVEELNDIKKRFEFLYNIKRSIYDLRDIREAAKRENKDYSRNEQKNKLFLKLVDQEFEKLRRDVKKRETLENQERILLLKNEKINNDTSFMNSSIAPTDASTIADSTNISVAMSNGISANSIGSSTIVDPKDESTNKRGNTGLVNITSVASSADQDNGHGATKTGGARFKIGGFLKSVRPFTTNLSNVVVNHDRIVRVAELPDPIKYMYHDSSKYQEYKVYNLRTVYNKVEFNKGIFKLHLDDNSEIILQAPTLNEAKEWIDIINEVKKNCYLSKELIVDSSIHKVFGMPVKYVCEREHRSIPLIVERLLSEIESRGLNEVGLYRVPGALPEIEALRQKFDKNSEAVTQDLLKNIEINTLAGCFKSYLRFLPESLLTSQLLPKFVEVMDKNSMKSLSADQEEQLLIQLINKLPYYNYHLLKRVIVHLKKASEKMEKNRMDVVNLSMVFSMSCLSDADFEYDQKFEELKHVLCKIILNPSVYFVHHEFENVTL